MDSQSSLKINYIFLPSMKHAALVKVASILWNQSDVRYCLFKRNSYDNGLGKADWQVTENTVMEKVPELQLPGELGECLISFIHQLGFQIFDWINFHVFQNNYVAIAALPREFFWTPQGNIDSKKVAETLVNDERLDIYARFRLACCYCIDEYAQSLFKELPKGFHKNLELSLERHWACYIAEDIDKSLYNLFKYFGKYVTFWHIGFTISVACGNEFATRYFLQRSTAEFRAKYLKTIAIAEIANRNSHTMTSCSMYHFSSNFCYLLSEMNPDEQMEFITSYAFHVLDYLLYWPWQNFFLKTVVKIGRFLSPKDYYRLLQAISKKISSGAKDFNYQNLFREFWQQSSFAYKKHVIMNEGLKLLAPALFSVVEDNIMLIFKMTSFLEIKEVFGCPVGLLIYEDLIKGGNRKLLKFFIPECISSKKVSELKEKIGKALCFPCCVMKKRIDMLNRFYQILCDIEQESSSKCIPEV